MQHLRAPEGNPLAGKEAAMFEMFERDGWSYERRLAQIFGPLALSAPSAAAE